MRKIYVFPIHVITFLLSLVWVIFLRTHERAKWMDRKINDFEIRRLKNKVKKKRK